MNELTIGDKVYVSSKRAAEITGYAKDYVGQLCREGHVEAKMVGRSWYVLESSLREHRFGKQEEVRPEKEIEAPQLPEVSLPNAWEPSTYIVEPVVTIPKITRAPRDENPIPATDSAEPALNEMQSAWREWFENRREAHFEAPEIVVEEQEEEYTPVHSEKAIPLPIQKIEDIRRREPEEVARPAQEMGHIRSERVIKPRNAAKNSTRANMAVVAVLVVLAGISITVAFIGSGHGASYLDGNPVVRFLGGASTVSK